MFRRLLAINTLLLIVLAAGALKLRRDALAFADAHRVDQIQPQSEKSPSKVSAATNTAETKEDWGDIAAHDPFSFDRNDVAIVAVVPAVEQPKRPKPFLFGIMKLGADHLALLGPGDAGNRSYQPVRSGETIDGWKLVEIQEKSVVVQWNDIKQSVIMDDPTAQIPRDYGKTGTANASQASVLNVGPAASSPGPAVNSEPANAAAASPSPTTGGRRQIVVQTPFGPKTIDEPLSK